MKTIVTEVEFEVGEVVFLKTDENQLPRIVFGYDVFANDITYKLACGPSASSHYPFEISKEKNVLIGS